MNCSDHVILYGAIFILQVFTTYFRCGVVFHRLPCYVPGVRSTSFSWESKPNHAQQRRPHPHVSIDEGVAAGGGGEGEMTTGSTLNDPPPTSARKYETPLVINSLFISEPMSRHCLQLLIEKYNNNTNLKK